MLRTRVIPCLLLQDGGLVKTIKFRNPTYIGDPINAVKIFNDKEVDELVFLDITASREGRGPSFEVIREIASECFMPLGYGGGIRTLQDIRDIFAVGVEKAIVNSMALHDLRLVEEAAAEVGSQSIVISMDVKKTLLGGYQVFGDRGTKRTGLNPVNYAQSVETAGAGEILLCSIDREGTGRGYDLELVKSVANAVNIPVVAVGGANSVDDFRRAVDDANASAVSAGSMFVFHGRHRAVLISYPAHQELLKAMASSNEKGKADEV